MISSSRGARWRFGLPGLRSLRHKVLLSFALIIVLAVSNILIVRALLNESDNVASTVNVAGKMRMLSQRIALEALAESIAPGQYHSHLAAQAETFEHVFHALMSGGTAFGLAIPAVEYEQALYLDRVGRDWLLFQEYVADFYRRIALNLDGRGAAIVDPGPLLASSGQLLDSVEALLADLIQHARNVQQRALYSSFSLFLLDLLLLGLAYIMVSRQVLKPIDRLVRHCQQLTAGNYAARTHLRRADELGRLGQALNESAAHIERLLDEVVRERASLKRAALVYAHTSEAMVVTDEDGHVQDINPAFTTITGYHADEVVGKRLNLLSSGRQSKEFYEAMWQSLYATGRWSGDLWNRRKSGEEYIEKLTINTSYNDDGSVNCRIGLFSDVTEKRRREASIWHQAHYDHLTQLPNRQMFHANLQRSIQASKESGRPFALVFLDLDFFKEVNDTFGHDEGDELLRLVSRRLMGCVRGSDLVARLGGDEFTLIIQNLGKVEDVMPICDKVLKAVAQPYVLNTTTVHISASVGVTFYPRDGEDAVALLKHADLAMYAAKDLGRNQYALFSADMRESAQTRRDLLRDMQLALDEKRFVLHYQPIVDLRSGRIVKAEALIRWPHPERGMVSPADFIPLAEDSGLIVPIGDWIYDCVLAQTQAWRQQLDPDFSISVNVSPVQFEYEGLDADAWVAALQRHGLPGSAVAIEITERLLMAAEEESAARLKTFRAAGVQIALDDFGTGYSSLSYLKRFKVDLLKIDQSFVHHLTPGSEDLVLCQAIILMAHQLGMQVVAEGIETEAHHKLLLQAGCDYGQGYWYGRPMPADDLARCVQNAQPVSSCP
ncbi:EAL domain-containing protein [Castellaniella hirudinis]|uniref:EAL domain-containing protein n=1 Tax=Castellaniella hirudinis TaxID=1144617 RepID=UPI0039C0CF71